MSLGLHNLCELDLSMTSFSPLGNYGTHHLSHLVNLRTLNLTEARDLLLSHITPLYLLPSLK